MAGIYLHIPFCKTRCIYCDFYSTTRSELKTRYVHALCHELGMRKEYLKGEPIETIYFGGGTPSQLEEADFKRIFETIRENYGMEHCREITLEANPDDLSQEYLKMLSSLPFNRISMGIQTFDDTTLRLLKRRHNSQTAIEAVRRCREAGFQNISIDLIYGLPGETKGRWENDLRQAIRLDVEHISAYHLTYEEDTPIYNMLKQHQISEVDEDSSLDFFTLLIEHLQKAGFEHYEISNFSKPGFESRHNLVYWDNAEYYGLGAGASGYVDGIRYKNHGPIRHYLEAVEAGKARITEEHLTLEEKMEEELFLGLRKKTGVSKARFEEKFGISFDQRYGQVVASLTEQGLLVPDDKQVRMTKRGLFLGDTVAEKFILE